MDNWVGFSPSPKAKSGAEINVVNFSIAFTCDVRDVLQVLTTQEGLQKWLGEVNKFEFKLGGKVSFTHADAIVGATYAAIQIPRSIVLITESVGQVTFSIDEKASLLRIEIKMSLIQNEIESWKLEVLRIQSRILEVLGE